MTINAPEQIPAQIQFSIADIQTVEFLIFNNSELLSMEKMKFPFKIDAGFFFEMENKIVGIDIRVDISTNSDPKPIVCHMLTRFKYLIHNFNEAFLIKDGNISYPTQFLTTLISISLSTARGILVSKTEGTNLRGIFMPIVDPSKFQVVPNTHQTEVSS